MTEPDDPRPPVWLVAGTRPEAIKLAPLAVALDRAGLVRPAVIATGQHPEMCRQALTCFDLKAERELRIPRVTGSQAELTARLTETLDAELALAAPTAVVVQGDTTSALVGALTAFWRRTPVVHLEAGLRSGDLDSPFPEEANRRLIAQVAALHLAPTDTAAANLVTSGVPRDQIVVTGNTVVDAVLGLARRDRPYLDPALVAVDRDLTAGRRLMLVTMHRRESWGTPLRRVLGAVGEVLDAHPDLVVVLPVHPNPAVAADVVAVLGAHPRVLLTQPLDYPDFARLLHRATLVVSDSGGVQEEAPSFGVPVLVTRDRTERVEGLARGCARLVGTDPARIVVEAARVLGRIAGRSGLRGPVGNPSGDNPYGDGHAGARAAAAIARLLGLAGGPVPEFEPGPLPEGPVPTEPVPAGVRPAGLVPAGFVAAAPESSGSAGIVPAESGSPP